MEKLLFSLQERSSNPIFEFFQIKIFFIVEFESGNFSVHRIDSDDVKLWGDFHNLDALAGQIVGQRRGADVGTGGKPRENCRWRKSETVAEFLAFQKFGKVVQRFSFLPSFLPKTIVFLFFNVCFLVSIERIHLFYRCVTRDYSDFI